MSENSNLLISDHRFDNSKTCESVHTDGLKDKPQKYLMSDETHETEDTKQATKHPARAEPMHEYFPFDGKIYKASEIRERISSEVYGAYASVISVPVYKYKPSRAVKIKIETQIDDLLAGLTPVLMTYTQYLCVMRNPSSLKNVAEQNKKNSTQEDEPKKILKLETGDKSELELDKDESYENAYGLIDCNVDDVLSELFLADDEGNCAATLLANSEDTDVGSYKEILSTISPHDYDESIRSTFILINYRLSCLGVAPRWRGIVRDGNYKSTSRTLSKEQQNYLRDIQAFDLEWLHRRYHGHIVDTTWLGVFDGIFSSVEFDTKKASVISGMSLKPTKKAEFLMLTPDMEKQLFMIRSKETDRFMNELLRKTQRVRVDLLTAAQRNRRRGSKLMANIDRRVNLWIASNIVPNDSILSTVENYAMITGEKISPSNCKRLLKSLNEALSEVGSRYIHS